MAEPLASLYPGAIDGDNQLGGDQVNIKTFTLGGNIGSGDTTIPNSGAISGITAPFYFLIESELIWVEGISGSNFTPVVRGAGGTSAAAHTSGTPMYVVYAANLFNQLKRAIVAIETEVGVDPAGSFASVVARLNDIDTRAGFDKGHLWGLALSNNGTDPTNDIDIATGQARDVDHTVDMILSSALTKRLDANWTVGNNQGMLDTGTVADGTYHIFLIKRTDTGVVDVLASTSVTSPTMPTNYTKKRRIGSIVRTGATIKPFLQEGDLFMWHTPVKDVDVTNPGTSAVLRTLTLPTGIRVQAQLSVIAIKVDTGGNINGVYISDPNVSDLAASITVFTMYNFLTVGVGALWLGAQAQSMTNTSAQIRSRIETSSASSRLIISTNGWIDTRGRLA